MTRPERPAVAERLREAAEAGCWQVTALRSNDPHNDSEVWRYEFVYHFVASTWELVACWRARGDRAWRLVKPSNQKPVSLTVQYDEDLEPQGLSGFGALTDLEYYLLDPERLLTLNRVK